MNDPGAARGERPRALFRVVHATVPCVCCPVTRGPEPSLFVLHQTGLGWPGGRCDNCRKVPT